MSRKKHKYILLFVGLLTLLRPMNAFADAAPPPVPLGENINPGEESTTMVQMVAEEVTVDVSAKRELIHYVDEIEQIEGYLLSYDCIFWMVNQGEEQEDLAVRFPLNGEYALGKIKLKAITVDGRSVPWTEDEEPNLFDYSWAHFDVAFPPGEEVVLRVTYTTVTRGWAETSTQFLEYILETGAGWYGPIGHGTINIRFPYAASPENVIPYSPDDAVWVFEGNNMVWEFTDLEPTRADNLFLHIIPPESWLEILKTKQKLQAAPDDANLLYVFANQIFQANVYKDIDIDSEALFITGLEAVQKAISLEGENPAYHELYAKYLLTEYAFDNPQLLLDEAEILLALDPGNFYGGYLKEYGQQYLDVMQNSTEAAAATATQLAQPTATPTPTATSTPKPTSTLTPTQPPVPTMTPAATPDDSSGSTTIIAVVVILVLAGVGVVWLSRRK